MRSFQLVFRNIFRKGQNTFAKILTLSLGLTFGLVLIGKVYFEGSYNTHYPDSHRIHQVSQLMIKYGEDSEYPQVSGGVVPLLKEINPRIEECTRFTYLNREKSYFTDCETGEKYKGAAILADTNFFKVLPRPMLKGNAKEILSKPMHVIISRSLAETIGMDAIGKMFSFDGKPDARFVLAGVFEDLPENTTYQYDLIFSMSSIGNYMGDGSENLMGNDRYIGFIKSRPGITPDELEQSVQENVKEYVPDDVKEEFLRSGFEYTLTLNSLDKIHESDKSVRQMKLTLLLLAIMLIVTSTMNYLLLVISVIINRAKQVAVYKCYGAGRKELIKMAMAESFIYLFIAVIFGGVLLLLLQNQVTVILNVSLKALFLSKGMLFVFLTLFGLFFLTTLITASFYQNIPIAAAFRNLKLNKRVWKLALLFVQFIAVGALLPLLFIVNRQYSFMVNDNPGYEYENLAYLQLSGVDHSTYSALVGDLKRLPEVADVTAIYQLPFKSCSGNNVRMPDNDDELFNIADFYYVKANYFDVMEIPIEEGSTFSGSDDQIMVDRNFVNRMREIGKWDQNSPVGKSISVTEHGGPFTVCGVYSNFRIGTIDQQDERPSVIFPANKMIIPRYIVIKFKNSSPEAFLKTSSLIDRLIPDRINNLYVWKTEMEYLYVDSYRFRNAVLIGFIATLLIVIIGMIGYMQDELNRRRKEIAIRIINGAEQSAIFIMYLIDILKISLPALLIGVLISYGIARRWLEQFSEKISLSWWIFALCTILTLCCLIVIIVFNVRKAIRSNPVDALKSE